MNNLAGKIDCDEDIRKELKAANIPIIELNSSMNIEVPSSVIGYLNGFRFKRAWSYWIVDGYMPLDYARKIYDCYKELSIRVAGNCTNPEPEGWSSPKNLNENCKPIIDRLLESEITYEEADILCKEIRSQGDQFITSYHIDTQEGLCRFADMIIYNNIISN